MELQSKMQGQKLESMIVEANMAEIVAAYREQASTVRKGPQWLAVLSRSVQPIATIWRAGNQPCIPESNPEPGVQSFNRDRLRGRGGVRADTGHNFLQSAAK